MRELLEIVNTVLPIVLVFLVLYFVHLLNKTVMEIMDEISGIYKELADAYKVIGNVTVHIHALERVVYGSEKKDAGNKKSGHDDIVDV